MEYLAHEKRKPSDLLNFVISRASREKAAENNMKPECSKRVQRRAVVRGAKIKNLPPCAAAGQVAQKRG